MTLRETLERLGAMPAFVEAALHEAGEENLGLRPSDEVFALVEQACHLRDLEREGYLVRVRRMLGEKEPVLDAFDGQAVAAARDYAKQDAHAALQDFAAARRELVAVVGALPADDLKREAIFEGRRITLAELVGMIDAHDNEHREEIERILDDIED
jgi:hypothetical protein